MRTILLLVLLLGAFARPARAQEAQLQPAQTALPARLTPASESPSPAPHDLGLRRDHARGAWIGSAIGAVTGVVLGSLLVCSDEGEGQEICRLAGIGLGALVGAAVGGIIGAP